MSFTIIKPESARPGANYAMAARVESGRLIHTGTIGPCTDDGRVTCPGDIGGQTRSTFDNLIVRLRQNGVDLSNIVRMTTFLARMADFADFVRARAEYLPGTMPPATLIELPRLSHPDALVQVAIVALKD